MANTSTFESGNSKRVTLLITGDGSGSTLTISNTDLQSAALAAYPAGSSPSLYGPLQKVLAAVFATQAAARIASINGPVKVFVRQRALPADAAQTSGPVGNPTIKTVVGAVAVEAAPDANAAGVAYSQVDQATIVTLLNDLKAKFNLLVTDHNKAAVDIGSLYTAIGTTATTGKITDELNAAIADITAVIPELGMYSCDVDLQAGAGTGLKLNLVMPNKTGVSYYVDIVFNWSASGL